MTLYFITGNKNKFNEAKTVFPDLERMDIDLPELQEVDAKLIIKHKLAEALKHHNGAFIVEDTSLYFDCLLGLPGPLIKWFIKTLGNDGLANIALKLNNIQAEAKTIIGYAADNDNVHYFEGSIRGSIVSPRGSTNFGWDPIFEPEGCSKTFAEMTADEKNKISMRRQALKKLETFIQKNHPQ